MRTWCVAPPPEDSPERAVCHRPYAHRMRMRVHCHVHGMRTACARHAHVHMQASFGHSVVEIEVMCTSPDEVAAAERVESGPARRLGRHAAPLSSGHTALPRALVASGPGLRLAS